MKNRLAAGTFACLVAAALAPLLARAPFAQDQPVPEAGPERTVLEITALLERDHYAGRPLDDELSSRVLDRYLDFLDPARAVFLASDVAELERYRTELDDALRAADLAPAYAIFERYAERQGEQIDYLEESLANELESLTFERQEFLAFDRREEPWPAGRAELEDLWRRRFKNDVLSLQIAGSSTEEIRDALERRYQNQRRLGARVAERDVFQFFANALAQSFDPHTRFMDTRRAENFDIQMSLSVQGIGALLGSFGEYVRIERLIPGGPAEGGGELAPADRIVAVAQGADGELVNVVGWRTDEVAELVRGPAGSTVRLSILPKDQPEGSTPRAVVIVRESVALEEQAAQSRVISVGEDDAAVQIGVVELPAFYMDFEAYSRGDRDFRSTTRDVAQLLGELVEAGVDGVVLDLRGNGGGSLIEVNELAGLFLGPRAVVQVRNARGRVEVLSAENGPLYDGPLLVLVNRLSASASEIFAGAIQDYGGGLVVGERTFGKGTVQSVVSVTDGDLLLTQAKFYRVTGASTQLRGVDPDLHFPSAYDPTVIGEEALSDALPWDEIRSLKVPAAPRLAVQRVLPELRERHAERTAADASFIHRRRRLEYRERLRETTRISLQRETRSAEQASLEGELLGIENDYRRARGEEPVEALEDLPRDAGQDDVDPLQREAARILADWAELRPAVRSDRPR